MSVSGKTRENKEFTKQTGFFEGEVVAINPTKDQLSKLLGVEIEDEIEYTSKEVLENGTEIAKAQVVFYVKDIKTGSIKNLRYFLKDLDRTNTIKEEEKGTKVAKKQYINSIGDTSWSDHPSNLPEWFTSRAYRVAKVGEEELYKFVRSWLNKLDKKDAETTLSFDFKKLMSGNVKELTEQINGEYDETVTALVTVRTVKKDGEDKTYEQVYNKNIMPGFAMKTVRTSTVDQAFIDRAKALERKKRNTLQKFVLEVADGPYKIKDFYTLGELEDYDPSKNPVAGSKVLSEDDTSY